VNKIIIDFNVIPLSDFPGGDYFDDTNVQKRFFIWLNALWQEKDEKIEKLKN